LIESVCCVDIPVLKFLVVVRDRAFYYEYKYERTFAFKSYLCIDECISTLLPAKFGIAGKWSITSPSTHPGQTCEGMTLSRSCQAFGSGTLMSN